MSNHRRRVTADDLAAMRARLPQLHPQGLARTDMAALLDEVDLADEQLGECWTLLHEMLACKIPLPRGFSARVLRLLIEQECPGYVEAEAAA